MHIKTIEKEFRLRGINCKVKRFKSDKLKGTGYTIHRETDITLGVNGNGGRLVCIDGIEDIEQIAEELKSEGN